ncbi:asparagine synthase-related protein [Bailinhaonella thermotolerans]|nr:asparagine synthase-related protein [Bailinhaonella thermotolerans]
MTAARRPDGPVHGLSWMCVLADGQDAALGRRVARTVRDVAGRLWLAGDPGPQQWRLIEAGPVQVVLIGFCPLDDAALRRRVEQAVARDDLETLARLPGDYLLLTRGPRFTRAYTDPAGLRRLFQARHDGRVWLSDRAGVLASVTGAGVDEQWLAARLGSPELPYPVAARIGPYHGVTPIPPGHRLTLTLDGRTAECTRYWEPPEAVLSLEEGAPLLGQALADAVSTRVGGLSAASCQLSGGLDSAALSALAARARHAEDRDTLLVTVASRTAGNDDLPWAREVADRLTGVRHQVLDPAEHPAMYAGLPGLTLPVLDEPVPSAASAARIRHLTQVLTAEGVGVHLNGQGGDEVLGAPVAYLREELRRRPRDAWRRIRGHAALSGVSPWRLLAALADAPSYRDWLAQAAGEDLIHAERDRISEVAAWEARIRLPVWATGQTVAILRDQLRKAATGAEPLAPTPARHHELVRLHAVARRSALYRDALETLGVQAHFPFYDRDVVAACLAVHPAQRTDPWQVKPLLHAALGPIVGPVLPERRTKGHYNHDIMHGLLANRKALLEMFDGSALAGLGLIDDACVRRLIGAAEAARTPPSFLNETLACEIWLRQLAAQTPKGTT